VNLTQQQATPAPDAVSQTATGSPGWVQPGAGWAQPNSFNRTGQQPDTDALQWDTRTVARTSPA
jgi:hypothetical protein